ncbi:Neuroligin-1-like 2 [Homarus americanus]|uniref:Neuroligin-1-like 2 n=1 Tax=Homarus americanus TaxID=6706 RepID=A0A8J5K2J1_HOMAM|nr:Neuroligin-1-like 2 [Homarus americanus]
MVYIHGESYEWNSGNPYDGSVLASFGQVVVITVNFRLGVLGFLRPALRENYVSNFGLLDQIAALHWIKSNIENFGGDPENVTIFGHGTGAALANFLLISPVAQGSQGLFQRAILMSGTALSRWAVTWEPYKYTIQVAKALGCPLNDRGDILTQCLQRKSVEELLSMKRDTSVFGKYDLLYGVALAESHHMLNSAEVRNGMNIDRRNRLLRAYIANNFDHHASQIYYSVINQYTPWNQSPLEDERKVRDQTLEILSDAQITAPVIQMADLHSNINQRSYFYVFNHQSIYGDYPVLQGTVHGEELPYVFGAPLVGGFNHFGLNYTLDEVFLSELVMTHLTNFARSGNPNLPTPQEYKTPGSNLNWVENMKMMWPPYEKQLQQYLHIDMQVVMKHHYRAQPIALWNNLIPNLISSNQGPPVPLPPGATPPTITLVPTIKPTLPIPFTEHPPTYPDNDWHIPGKPKPPQKPDYPDTYPEEPVESQAVTPTPPPPVVAGTPISIVIVVGICILFINCCAMGGVYYQRDKIRHQSRLLRKTLRPRKAEDSEERVSDAATSTTQKERTHRKKGSRSDYEVSDEIHSDSVSRASGVSRESTMRRKHSQPAHDTASKHETPKSSLKSTKSPKSGHKRHKSENSIYSEIGKTADVHVHAEEAGPSRSKHAKNPTVKFNTLGASLPPKAVTKSTTSITSKASIKSNTSRASVKSTASRSSIKSTSSEKRLKKNASCQSLPTAEYTWGITPEMTMTERDDPDGRDDQRSPADRQQTLVAMQKLNYPKVLPDRPEVVHAATLPKMRPPPPPRSTSLTAHDIQELEDKVHVVYRKKRNPRRDASTDSCDLSGVDNIYLMGADVVPSASMYGAPAATATVSRTRSRKTDGTSDYGRTGGTTEYVRSGTTGEYGLSAVALDFGRPAAATDYCHQGGSPGYGGYTTYEPTYMYKDSTVPSPPKTPTTPQPGDATKIFGYGGPRVPRVPLATFGKINNHSPGDGSSHPEQGRPRPTYESSTTSVPAPNTAAAVTAAAQTALATATAPAFVGASNTNRSAPRGTVTPAPAATHTVALRQQSSTTSGSDTGTVYEQSENTGTIKRRKSVKKENVTKSVVTQDTDKPYDKPLKGVLKQTSAYDKPKPLMAKAPGASPSASASSLSSNTSVEVGSGASGTNETAHEPLQKTPSVKKGTRVATPGIRRKNKSDNHTTTATMQTDSPK